MSRVRLYLGNFLSEANFDPLDIPKGGDAESSRVKLLEDDIEKLSMVVRALIDAVVRKNLLTREQIRTLVREIDESDGMHDGTARRVPMGRPGEKKPRTTTRRKL